MKQGTAQTGYSFIHFVRDGLLSRFLHTLLTMFGIAVALGSAVTLVGVVESVESSLSDGYALRKVDLVLLQANKADPMTSRLSITMLPKLEALQGVSHVQALLLDFLSLDNKQNILAYGWPENYDEIKKKAGNGKFVPLEKNEVLMGKAAASLGGFSIGDNIEINLGVFHIAGFFETESIFESGVIYMRLDDLQKIAGVNNQVTFFFIELKSSLTEKDKDGIQNTIKATFPGTQVLTSNEFIKTNNMTDALRGLSVITLITSTILAILIVSTIMVLSVTERYQELGILRAIGWSSYRVSGLIITESMIITILGSLMGVIFGWAGLELALVQLQSMGIYAESVVTWSLFIQAGLATVVIGLAGAAIPAYHAQKIRVMEALRHE
ncbi:MAG: ABC transporter permease [Gammaproteobacteria bacterium]|nr:ABC transporter permease [Gammaproteobacteria bacterium]